MQGYPRKGSVALDQIYVRKHGDGNSLVVGVLGGKEFKMTSEGKDPGGRVNDWYDRLTNQMVRSSCDTRVGAHEVGCVQAALSPQR